MAGRLLARATFSAPTSLLRRLRYFPPNARRTSRSISVSLLESWVSTRQRRSLQKNPSPQLYPYQQPQVTKRTMVQGVTIDNAGCIINTNPATGEEISRVPTTSTDELNRIVERAVQAQPAWSRTPVETRIDCLRAGLAAIAAQQDDLVQTMVREMGKPLKEAVEEVQGAVDRDEYLQILLDALQPVRHKSSIVVREAVGVVAVLSPWNFPADEILLLVLPALASGNTVIVKPSEVAPETGAAVVQALASALPSDADGGGGILQLVQGDGVQGAQLVAHPSTSMIAMTGSSATGKRILEQAAPQLKKVVLELGGKDPMVVFAEQKNVDLDQVARDAVTYSLCNSGQVCCSVERIYVADAIYADFCQRVAHIAATEFKVGNGLDPDVSVGPLVSAVQQNKVQEQVQDALDKGATLLHQSEVPKESKGNFFPITVLSDVQDGMKLYREETFGPVVSLTPFDGSEQEAIRLANDTEYGLAGAVYTSDLAKAQRVANAIQAGQVGINCYSLDYMDVACPWVGHKQSGFGYHSGKEGFHQFSIPKTLVYTPKQAPPASG